MRIALYSRVSTESQEQEQTIQSQISTLEDWAKTNNHEIVERYFDDGYSGTLLARPELDRLRDDASKGIFEAIAIHSPDRLARKYIYQEIVIEELKNKGVQVLFLNRSIAETPEDQLLLGVQGVISEYERMKILERTRRGRLHRVRSNHILGNIPPFGYKLVKKGDSKDGFASYIINDEEAKTVKNIFSLLVDKHMTTYGVVCELNRIGINSRNNKRWAKSSISKILRNETYTGTTYYNKHMGVQSQNGHEKYHKRKNTTFRIRPKEEWIAITGIPQIIEQTVFLKAQRQLQINSLLSERNTKNQYLLKGLIKCSKDDRSYYGVPIHSKPYYRCSGKSIMVSNVKCTSPSIKADVIEPLIWDTVKDLLNNPRLIIDQLKRRSSKSKLNVSKLEDKIHDFDDLINKVKIQENRLLKAYGEGIIESDQLKDQNERLQTKREVLIIEREKLNKQKLETPTSINVKNTKLYINGLKNVLNNITFEQKQAIIRELLKEIVVDGRHLFITGFIPVQPQNVLLRPQLLNERSSRRWKNITCKNSSINPTPSDI